MTRRLPAEWEPQQAVLLTWPRADGDFARWFGAVETCFIDIASAAARFQPVWISTAGDPEALRRRLLERGIDAARLRVLQQPSDDVWVRDHGPITVLDDEQAVHVDFRFNGWGGKFAAERDDALSAGLHARGLLPGALEAVDYVLEGGAIDVDGRGSDGDGREFPGCVAPEGVVRERERELRPGWETWGVTRCPFTFFES